MAEPRFPTIDEFWQRLETRGVEPDLRAELHERVRRESQRIQRLPEATTTAVMARLLPAAIAPGALAAFIDTHFDRQLGRGDDRAGVMPRGELIPLGLALLDEQAGDRHGRGFAELDGDAQDALLAAAERGELPAPARFDWAIWFRRLRALALLGLGSDPRGMVFMGFPGPSFRSGHVWLDAGEVAARAARRPGHLQL